MATTRRCFLQGLALAAGSVFAGGCAEALDSSLNSDGWRPAYADLEDAGMLAARIEQAYAKLEQCDLCPHACGVNRLGGETGFCEARGRAVVHSHGPHFGEELPLVGRNGSGTIFFSHCNLRCVFCQNWPIAHLGHGRELDDARLADLMLDLQRRGCHNINLVTPTHFLPNILGAVRIARQQGLRLPLCYNTGGYETVENVRLLDGVVDIYLPDLKFMSSDESARYVIQGRGDYPAMAKASILEMHRQVGDVDVSGDAVARRGLLIRHLVMPNQVSGTREFVDWVARELPQDTYVNIMSQYRVEHMAFDHEPISRAITSREYVEAMDWAMAAGLTNLDNRSLANLEIHRRMLE
ncbi:radical SAM protein [Desulfonatronum sp. SC1]|uniref:radical SAM protein n=1 Tax=Desulfonatronum sp. SC1 TaxID=2109626 RepID=UPI000D2FB3F2|nr:radical SAM protein [Desulfonatronum sp. SC1]PTN34932.1 radical SAM protein [Desulfonatronum sp. SC1]